jgi:spoIIIJ-associated protein
MSTTHEFEGKTVEDTIRMASETLGIPKKDLNVEVLSYGSTGIFGLVGIKKAKIRVQIRSKQVEREVATEKKLQVEQSSGQIGTTPPSERLLEEIAMLAKQSLIDILNRIVDDAIVTSEVRDKSLILTIESTHSALLIGKRGQTMDAIQYIIQKIVNKRYPEHIPVIVDTENYRDRRKASLTQLALRLAEKVKHSGKPATIRPMNAYERRIVHLALQPVREVTSKSRGTGHLKKMIIFPQENGHGANGTIKTASKR